MAAEINVLTHQNALTHWYALKEFVHHLVVLMLTVVMGLPALTVSRPLLANQIY